MPDRSHRNKARRGQLIIESMVALSVGVTGILGILGLLSRSLSLNRVVADNYQASLLAAEGVEIIKNIIDENQIRGEVWNDVPEGGTYTVDLYTQGDTIEDQALGMASCNPSVADSWPSDTVLRFESQPVQTQGIYSHANGTETRFRRCVEVAHEDSEHIQVNSVVAWTVRGGGKFSTNVEDHFYHWRRQP